MKIGFTPFSQRPGRYFEKLSKAIARSLERIAKKRRIQSASDDPAGLARLVDLQTQSRSIVRATKNIDEALQVLGTARSALQQEEILLKQVKAIAEEAGSDSLTAEEREDLNEKLGVAVEKIRHLLSTTHHRGQYLLDGSYGERVLQVGNLAWQTSVLHLGVKGSDPQSILSNLFSTSVTIPETSEEVTRGTGVFTSFSTFNVGNSPSSMIFADIDNDGDRDLMVANSESDDLSIRLSNGDGTFSIAATVSAPSPRSLSAEDLNGDGKKDLLITDDQNNLFVRLGNADGTFSVGTSIYLEDSPHDLTTADFDGDGKMDFAVGRFGSGTVSVFRGNGDGTFEEANSYALGGNTQQLVAADLNGDGKTDLAVANGSANTVSVLVGNGDGSFQVGQTIGVDNNAWGMKSGDLNGDGNVDLVVTHYNSGGASVRLGNGDGTFSMGATLTTGFGATEVAIGDLDGDGHLDLGIVGSSSSLYTLYKGNGDGTFSIASTSNSSANGVYFEDLNDDSVLDVSLMFAGTGQIHQSLQSSETQIEVTPEQILSFGMNDLHVSTKASAENLLLVVNSALQKLDSQKATVSSQTKRLEFTRSAALRSQKALEQVDEALGGVDILEESNYLDRLLEVRSSQMLVLRSVELQASLLRQYLSAQLLKY